MACFGFPCYETERRSALLASEHVLSAGKHEAPVFPKPPPPPKSHLKKRAQKTGTISREDLQTGRKWE